MEILGFWKKLFTQCVSVSAYKGLSNVVESLRTTILEKDKVIDNLSKDNDEKRDTISKLKETVNKLENEKQDLITLVENQKETIDDLQNAKYLASDESVIAESVIPVVTLEELNIEKEKHNVTLLLLKDAEDEIERLKNNAPIVYDECMCCEEEVTVPQPEEVIGDGTFEKEDVLKGADAVVTNANKIENFINSLTNTQKKELKDDILKGHKNDKRLTSTMKNWIKKHTNLDTQVYFMFKTALSRRRGKNVLDVWYKKYDDMTK